MYQILCIGNINYNIVVMYIRYCQVKNTEISIFLKRKGGVWKLWYVCKLDPAVVEWVCMIECYFVCEGDICIIT
ncbi:hypothetical protein CI610_03561 [invertebrate metagenome]|uniref:Uncharacterized protein n=1 Tax=invertebrate metagenome TaxID=1711999 RepID=A0A2H9T2Q5_9ZZZZ